MGRMSRVVGHEVLHAGKGLFLTRLAGQHHEHDPLDLFGIQLLRVQGQQAIQHDLALQRRQDAVPLQVQKKAARLGGQTRQFAIAVETQARGAARLFRGLLNKLTSRLWLTKNYRYICQAFDPIGQHSVKA